MSQNPSFNADSSLWLKQCITLSQVSNSFKRVVMPQFLPMFTLAPVRLIPINPFSKDVTPSPCNTS